MTRESKLIPILREGVNIIKIILYKELKRSLAESYQHLDSTDINHLAGAILNALFGTPHDEDQFIAYSEKNLAIIEEELCALSRNFPELRIPITDALRIQFLCDSLEGINNEAVLIRAKEKGILLADRELPLPNHFIPLARTLGVSYHILQPSSLDHRIQ
jgi:hypothetical protein